MYGYSMTFSNITALFGAMVILAAIPSLSVFTVVARSIASGFIHGSMTAIGIVIGDIIFIILAIYGLSAIAETAMSNLLIVIKYCGGAYLIWLGIMLSRSQPRLIEIEEGETSYLSSFLSGLLITLGDQKAILFYISFFPAFINLKTVTAIDTMTIIAIASLAVGGVKLGYAYTADKARLLLKRSKTRKSVNLIAASVMIITGIYLIAKN